MGTVWLREVTADDVDRVGGKGASLGELLANDLPVPPGFVVTAETYRTFLEETGIEAELFETIDVDPEDSTALKTAAERAQSLLEQTPFPEETRAELLSAYDELGGDVFVAVRSSATAEDLPDASFAGQQETFLNVTREDLVDRVRSCWASLFTQRAIYYRNEQGFSDFEVDIAVVVQEMVDAEKSGVLFTSHPSTGGPQCTIEAAWGLGEAVVSGTVTPDTYVVDRETGDLLEETVSTKRVQFVKDGATGATIEEDVPEADRDARVLSDEEIARLLAVGERVEAHYETPQDVEWAIVEDDIYLLQSRPITTIDEAAADAVRADGATTGEGGDEADYVVAGLGAVPGTATGRARLVRDIDEVDRVEEGDVLVTEMTTPDMVAAIKRADGIVTDEGGMTSHAAIVARELGVPAVVGTKEATRTIDDGAFVRLDGQTGLVTEADPETATGSAEATGERREAGAATDAVVASEHAPATKPLTATRVKVNVSFPEAAEQAAATGADGVGLLRLEHMVLSTGKTPERFVEAHGEDAFVSRLVDDVRVVADEFYPRPVRVRTLDAPTDEFRQLEGGEGEPREHNPMLGFRGIRRSLAEPDVFEYELRTFKRLYEMGYDNVELMFPLVNDAEDVLAARECLEAVGIDPKKRSWGVMVETPAAALSIESICEAGVDFVSFGTNDLTQYTLAVDRNNERVADRFDELHPAVITLLTDTIETCREYDVPTSICGQAGSNPRMARHLVDAGITSISANFDAVRDIQEEVKRIEQRYILESVRER